MKLSLKLLGTLLGVGVVVACADTGSGETTEPPPSVIVDEPDSEADAGVADGCDGAACAPIVDCTKTDFCPVRFPDGTSPTVLNAVWGSGPNDVWMVGAFGVILHWDGAALTRVPSGVPQVLFSVRGTGPNDVWVGGGSNVLLHTAGADGPWTNREQLCQTMRSGPCTFTALWSSASFPLFTTGPTMDRLRRVEAEETRIDPQENDGWFQCERSNCKRDGRALWGSSAGELWIVGEGGLAIITSNPAEIEPTFRQVETQTLELLNSIWGTGPDNIWVAGSHGTVRHWTNAPSQAFAYSPPLTERDLYGVSGTGPSDVWVVGEDAVLEHFDGTAWRSVPIAWPDAKRPGLYGVWAAAPDDVWVVGDGTILRTSSKVPGGIR